MTLRKIHTHLVYSPLMAPTITKKDDLTDKPTTEKCISAAAKPLKTAAAPFYRVAHSVLPKAYIH